MKFSKAIKRIVALGMGATMLGATVLSATAAADLSKYPAPFIKNGKFMGTLVIGDKADTEDVIGVSDIAMSLQYAATVKAGTGSATTTTVEGDAFRISSSGDELNFNQPLRTVVDTLDNGDLKALADGTFKAKKNVDFTQTLKMPGAVVQYVVDSDSDNEDPALYLKFGANASRPVIDYELSFNTAAESIVASDTLSDFEDQKISMLGREYTITQASNSTGEIELTLMAGAVQDTLEVGQTKKYQIDGKDYEVTVMVVSGDTSSNAEAKLVVNDEVTDLLLAGDTFTLKDGTDLGIKEVIPTKSGDAVQNLVEFYLGAQKLVLTNGASPEIGEDSISDATVTIESNPLAGALSISSISLSWTPDDDYYLPVGGKLSQAIADDEEGTLLLEKLGIDYQFAGLEKSPTETIKFSPSGSDSYKLEFTNKKGVLYDMNVFNYTAASNQNVALAQDTDKEIYVKNGDVACSKDYFVFENDKNSRIMQLVDINTNNKQIQLKDMGTGDTNKYTYTGATNASEIVLDAATYELNVTGSTCVGLTKITTDSSGVSSLWTKYGAKIALSDARYDADAAPLTVYENEDGKEDDTTSVGKYVFNFTYTENDLKMSSGKFYNDGSTLSTVMIDMESVDNKKTGYTNWGNYIVQSATDDQDKWEITVSDNEAVAEVYVLSAGAAVTASEGATGDTVIINKINVGATKLASEIAAGQEKSQNLILVGGPCANAAVERASADFPTCTGWKYNSGEALIQMVEQTNGNVALLVAGTDGKDTRTATSVVADMKKLQALPAGTAKQLVTVTSGGVSELKNVPAEPAAPAPNTGADNTTTD